MVALLARALHPRHINVVADAAYRSPTWRSLPAGITFTTRLATNATLYAPAPPATERRGRPRTKGQRLGKPADLATATTWQQITLTRYGKTVTIKVAVVACLWYGSLGPVPVQVILVREPGSDRRYDIALVTTDLQATAADVVCRYAAHWSIEQAIKDGKDLLGAGDAQNPVQQAVQRTVPFTMLCQSSLLLSYHHTGDAQTDLAVRRRSAPWYQHKTHISLDDMLIALRRTRTTVITAAHDQPEQITTTAATCASTAA